MPELPEVETIKNQLNRLIKGKVFGSVDVFLKKGISPESSKFKRLIRGAKINLISRRAKIFIFELNNGFSLLVHLKMTGQLVFVKNENKAGEQKNKHTRLVFHFQDGSCLLFNDLRQFGYIKLVKNSKVGQEIKEGDLGPEPLKSAFTLATFEAILKKRPRRKIKQLLMDQSLVAGIGNIYSDEILFYSRVHPLKIAGDLNKTEIKSVYQNIKKVLTDAIKARGTSAKDYLDAQGKKGSYDKKLKVYGKKGQKCPRGCPGVIERIKIGGRSAHFCPQCQK